MTYRTIAIAGVIFMLAAWARADLIYTNDGKEQHVIVLREDKGGYSVQHLDGTRKYYRKEEVKRIDRSNKFAEMYFAVAGSLDLQEKGGTGYFWLGYRSEKDNEEGVRFLYTVGLQDDEIAPYAAYQLSLTDTDIQERINHLRLAIAGCPWVTNQDVKRLRVAVSEIREKKRSLNGNDVLIFYNIVKLIGGNRAIKATKLWADFYNKDNTVTTAYLESLCKACTGYTFKALNQEMLYLAGSSDKNLWMCQTCNGKGKLTCARCKGKGYFICDKCKGAGVIQKRITSAERTRMKRSECAACSRRGYSICSVCYNYTKYQRTVRLRMGKGGIRSIKISGFKTCPHCKGSGRKPGAPKLTGKVIFISLKGEQARTAFKNLGVQVWRLLSTEDSWASTTVHIPKSLDFSRDTRSIPYRFYNGRWISSNAIDTFIAKGKYTPPSSDNPLLKQYRDQLTALVIPKTKKVSTALSGDASHQDALADLANYYEFMSSTGENSSHEFRKVYSLTFKEGRGGEDNIDVFLPAVGDGGEIPEFLLKREKFAQLAFQYCVRISENVEREISQLMDKAIEVTFYARIASANCTASSSERGLTISHAIEINPIAATVRYADGRTYEWVKTETQGSAPALLLGDEND